MKLKLIFLIFVSLLTTGIADANPDIEIQPVQEGSTILVPVVLDADAYQTSGLAARYHNGYGKEYSVRVEKDGAKDDDPPEWEENGILPGDDKHPGDDHEVEIHWKPNIPKDHCEQDHTVHVKGGNEEKKWRLKTCKPVPPLPELPTSALMSIGLAGLAGMMWLRRRD